MDINGCLVLISIYLAKQCVWIVMTALHSCAHISLSGVAIPYWHDAACKNRNIPPEFLVLLYSISMVLPAVVVSYP